MRVLVVNTDYPAFLRSFHDRHPGLEDLPYREQVAIRSEEPFGVSQFYVRNLTMLGIDAAVVHANNGVLQQTWAAENGETRLAEIRTHPRSRLRRVAGSVGGRRVAPLVRRSRPAFGARHGWVEKILAAQIRSFEPDVVVCLDMISIDPLLLAEAKRSRPRLLLVGQHGAVALPPLQRLDAYNLVVSSNMPTVDRFRADGLRAEHLQLAFEASLVSRLRDRRRPHRLSFVGSFIPGVHDDRIALLEAVARHHGDLRVWAPNMNAFAPSSPIRERWQGPAWGLEMLQVLHDSQLTLNFHGDAVARASNCRLFEATGVGAGLLTDRKPNLPELFDVGREVLDFGDPDECVAVIGRALGGELNIDALAAAGQRRTLRDHTYLQRMEHLLELVASLPQPVARAGSRR